MYIENFSTINDVLKDFCKTLCEEGLEDNWTLEYPDSFDNILETRKAVISTAYPLIDIKSVKYNKDLMTLEDDVFLIKDLEFEEVLEIKCKDLILYENKNLNKLENIEYFIKNDVIYIKFDGMKDEEISIKYKDRKKANLKWFVEFNYPEKIKVNTDKQSSLFGKVHLPTEQNNNYYIEWKYGYTFSHAR